MREILLGLRKRLGLAPTLAVNSATREALVAAGLPDLLAARLWRESNIRPFIDIADMQHRCRLGPDDCMLLLSFRLDFSSPLI